MRAVAGLAQQNDRGLSYETHDGLADLNCCHPDSPPHTGFSLRSHPHKKTCHHLLLELTVLATSANPGLHRQLFE